MSNSFEVINDALLVREVKVGFDSLNIKGGLNLALRDRAGSVYNNFSNKVEVMHTFEGSEFKVGSIILVHHFVKDQVVSVADEDFLLCYPEQILANRTSSNFDVLDDRFLEDFTGINGFLAYPTKVESFMQTWGNEQTNHKTNTTTAISGEKIEYLSNADYEIYHNEKMVFFIKQKNIYLVNDVLQEQNFTLVTDSVVTDRKRAFKTISGDLITLNSNVLGKRKV